MRPSTASLFIQARGALKKELMDYLRSKRRMRRSRHSSEHGHSRGQIVDAVSIRERPAEAKRSSDSGSLGRRSAGRWAKNSYIATLVERHSRFLMLVKVPSKETEPVVAALSEHVRQLPATLRRRLADLGSRARDGQAQGVYGSDRMCRVYFCTDPQSPLGNAARTRIPICYCGNTSREELI